MLDLDNLEKSGVISRPTRHWLEPLWHQEQDEARQVEENAAAQASLFRNNHAEDDDDDDDLDTMEEQSIVLNGVSFSYLRDHHSVGHGNRVWHASIATCLYLSNLFIRDGSNENPNHHGYCLLQNYPNFQSLELGAGTAIPSLYLAQILAKNKTSSPSNSSNTTTVTNTRRRRPVVHITDGKQYHNIRQILLSINRQSSNVGQHVDFRVSPHNWGDDDFNDDDDDDDDDGLSKDTNKKYDLVIVSDCIYNPNYHAALLKSIAATLKYPLGEEQQQVPANGGRAIVSFSLHGNTNDATVWNFLDMASHTISTDQKWKLQALPLASSDLLLEEIPVDEEPPLLMLESVGRGGFNMEDTMKQLDLWVENLDPKRWVAYLYELTWIPASSSSSS